MRNGSWIVLASQAELLAGILLAQHLPPSVLDRSLDYLVLGTALAYIPTALVGGILAAQEKGYHFLVGFFLGLFSIPGLVILLLIPPYVMPAELGEEGDDAESANRES
jgi:hypothetical protein